MNRGSQFGPKLPAPPKEELEALYKEMRSKRKIADHYNVSLGVVVRWMNERGIKNLTNHAARTGIHVVPVRTFGPILRRLLDQYPIMTTNESGPPGRRFRSAFEVGDDTKAAIVGKLCKVPGRKLMAILRGHQKSVSFTTCDKITTFFGVNHLWHEPPLNRYYWAPNDIKHKGKVSARVLL